MNFIDTPMCKSRMQCVTCRQNENYRRQMEQKFGPWKCPLGIAIDTALEDMPQEARNGNERKEAQIRASQERNQKITSALDALESMVSFEGYKYIDILRSQFQPKIKTPETCAHGKNKVGQIDQECCGGQIKKVDAYECIKHGVRTTRDCARCDDWSRNRSQTAKPF